MRGKLCEKRTEEWKGNHTSECPEESQEASLTSQKESDIQSTEAIGRDMNTLGHTGYWKELKVNPKSNSKSLQRRNRT